MRHRRMPRSWPRWLIGSVLFATAAACAPGPGPATPREGGPDAGGPSMAKTVTIAIGAEPAGLAHLEPTQPGSWELRNIYHAGLAVWDHQLQPRPQLSSELPDTQRGTMAILPDGGMEVTYRIRPGLTWDDGAPFTARDLAFAWRVGADPKVPVTQRRLYQLVDVVEARDDLTLYTRWPEPYAFAHTIHQSDIFPMPAHLLEELYRRDVEAMLAHPWFGDGWVGLGPYRLAQWERGSHWAFTAREGYALEPAKIGRVIVRFISDPNTLLTNLLSGTVDVAPFPSLTIEQGVAAREEWEARGLGKVHFTSTSLQRLQLQPRSPLFQDPRMRQALLHGMNRPEMAETVAHGLVEVAHSLLHPREPAFRRADRLIQKYDHSPQRAAQLLADLGWRRGADGVLVSAIGERLDVPWHLTTGDTEVDNLTAAIPAQWKALGIEVHVTPLSRTVAREPEVAANFPGVTLQASDTTVQSMRLWWHSSFIPRPETRWTGNNRAGWANPRADTLLDEFYVTLSDSRRQDLLVEIARLWAQDLPALPIWFQAQTVAIASRVQNASPRPNSGTINNTLWNVADWDIR